MSERYFCDVGDCGRAFTSLEDLENHKQRRHQDSSDSQDLSILQETSIVTTPKLTSFKVDTLRRPLSGVTNPKQFPPKAKNIDLDEIKEILGQTSLALDKTNLISEEYILDITGQDELEDVNIVTIYIAHTKRCRNY